MTRGRTLGVLVGICAIVAGFLVWHSQRFAVTMEKLADNLYVIAGTGMNLTALVTDDGVVLVDTMPNGWWGPAALAKLRTVTDQPVKTIINTNSHPAHSGNNVFFSPTVVEVVAQENTSPRMKLLDAFKGVNSKFLPGTTFRDKMSFVQGHTPIDLYYFGAANTNGDAWVVFPTLHTMSVGDIVTKHDLPAYERIAGGSGVSQPDTLAKALATIKNVGTIVVGHSYEINDARPTLSWKELGEQQRLSVDLLAAVRHAMLNGRSAAEVTAMVHATDAFKKYKATRVAAAVEAIYDELNVDREDATLFPGVGAFPGGLTITKPNDEGCCVLFTPAR
jgi:glyoxylase-like metal-dependent hydrolase (beta-lactamase superfamily II)